MGGCRPNRCSLPDEFLPASGKATDASGKWERMGEVADVHGLRLFFLCVLPEDMVCFTGRNALGWRH